MRTHRDVRPPPHERSSMHKRSLSLLGAATLLVSGLGVATASAEASSGAGPGRLHAHRACPAPAKAHVAACFSKVMVNRKGLVPASTTPAASARTPSDIRGAYNLTG